MILHALQEYYDRSGELAAPGWEWKRIPFLIEITGQGGFVQLMSMRHGPKAADVTSSLVPKGEVRSGSKAFEKPNLLWDHVGFVLGHAKSEEAGDRSLAEKQFAHFRQRVEETARQLPTSRALEAIRAFYDNDEHLRVRGSPRWLDCTAVAGCNVTFRLVDQIDIAVLQPEVRALIDQDGVNAADGVTATCLVTGETDVIQRLHFPIAGVGEKPAPLAAINDGSLPAFASFGKSQGDNFPVGHRASFKYSTALNHLLRPGSPQKLRVADATAVFWAQTPEPMEDWLAQLIGGGTDDPDAHTQQVKALFDAVRSGGFGAARGATKFYVLGLAPNAARIAVRFWHAAPLAEIAQRVVNWFEDLRMARGPNDAEFPSLFRLLTAVAVQNKADNIPPRLGGDIVRSLFMGTPYPAHWLQAAVQRCRAERQVNRLRAAAIKACLNRAGHTKGIDSQQPWEMKEMLDPDNPSPGYRLGRLFAALEKIQEEASPGLNTTIRERYYGAASSTPVAVFTTLMRLKNHHLAKLNKGRAVNLEKLLAEIVAGISDFPVHLSLQDQGRFAIGYYHQRQDFYTNRDATSADIDNPQGGN